MFRQCRKYNSAFTLIELLVTVSIISVLASTVIAATANAKRKAQDSQIVAQAGQIRNALELYHSENGGYPNPTPGVKGLWCVGGNGCALYSNGEQKYVSNQLSSLSVPNFNLPPVYHDGGYDQGIIYESCGADTEYCPSASGDDVINPDDPQGGAEIVYNTYSSGNNQYFVGTWNTISNGTYTTYTPPATAWNVFVDVWVTYNGVDYGLNKTNSSEAVPFNKIGDLYTVSWSSINASSNYGCLVFMTGPGAGYIGGDVTGSISARYTAPVSITVTCTGGDKGELSGEDSLSLTKL